ncbi:MAG: helix-turn-helix domain-containing protein [Bacilli bacterium]|nr:helix-turn-helix domain-containing protein [Bacilli bacterium]
MKSDTYCKNIIYLRNKAKITNEQLASFFSMSVENLKQILYGRGVLSDENKRLFCEIFGVSIDDLENKDIREREISFSLPNLLSITPIEFFEDSKLGSLISKCIFTIEDSSIDNQEYLEVLSNFRKILNFDIDAFENFGFENTFNVMLDTYKKTSSPEVCINCLNFLLFWWIAIQNVLFDVEKSFIENNHLRATDKKSIVEEKQFEFLEKYYFLTIELLNNLSESGKYPDFIPYYLALKMVHNFLYQKLEKRSNEEAKSFGLTLLTELEETGNKYAKKLFNSIGDFF